MYLQILFLNAIYVYTYVYIYIYIYIYIAEIKILSTLNVINTKEVSTIYKQQIIATHGAVCSGWKWGVKTFWQNLNSIFYLTI